jgi:hypothetical protein
MKNRCYIKEERSGELAAWLAGPWTCPGGINFAVLSLCIAFSIFSHACQHGTDLVRAKVRETRKSPETDAVAVSFASPSIKEGRATAAIAMHSNV